MKDIAILGASGHARDILWLLENINEYLKPDEQWNLIGFYDKDPSENSMFGYPVYDEKELAYDRKIAVACGAGIPSVRQKIMVRIKGQNTAWFFPTLISPNAVVSKHAQIGEGTLIYPGAMIMAGDVKIGDFAVVHINSTVGHDSHVGDYVQINPGCNISGWSRLDGSVMVGTGVKIIPKIHVGNNAIIGAGAVVTKDIPENCTAVGVPAKIIKKVNN